MTDTITSRTLGAEEYDALVEQVTTLVGQTGANGEQAVQALCGAIAFVLAGCPSSDDLRQFGCFRKGGSGSSVVEIKRHAGDAANDDLRWSGV